MHKWMLVIAFLFLAACATTANYEKILNSWIGADELDLLRRWGPPQNVYESGGRKFLTYSSARNVYIPGTDPTYTTTVIGNRAYTTQTGGTPGENLGLSCITTFEVASSKVVSWHWKGNDCIAPSD